MPRPTGRGRSPRTRGGSSRGGGYGQRPSGRNSSYNGASNGRGSNGGNQAALIAALGGGVVVVIILIFVLVGSGGDQPPANLPGTGGTAVPAYQPPAELDPNLPPPRLSDQEKATIHELVMRLAEQEMKAKRLKNEGFEAHQAEDRERAQACWREARDILQAIIGEAEMYFEDLGSERVDRWAHQDYKVAGAWPRLLSEFIKYIE